MTFDLVAANRVPDLRCPDVVPGFVILRENPRQIVNRATAGDAVFGGLDPSSAPTRISAPDGAPSEPPFQDVFARFAFLWEFFFPATLVFALVFPRRTDSSGAIRGSCRALRAARR